MNNVEKLYIDIIVDMRNRLSELETVESDKKFWMDCFVEKDAEIKKIIDIVKDNENDSEEIKALKKQVREVLA
nr:MAG TPA: PCRF domain protein [Caudoviricetes sp.]